MANKSYQYITKHNSPNYTGRGSVPSVYGRARTIDGFTYHWWGDPKFKPTFDGVVSWLCRPNGNSSAHYVVEAGRVACIVGPYDAAWHAGNALGNASTIGIECNPRASAGDYKTIGQFTSQLVDAFGNKKKYRHSNWTSTQCPGVYDLAKITAEQNKWVSGKDWGDVTAKTSKPKPTPAPTPPKPAPAPDTRPEWVKNLKDITDTKLSVIPAAGIKRVDLLTGKAIQDVIPKGTQIDIAKETTVKGVKYYISSYSAKANVGIGLPAKDLGVPAKPPVAEKPEWLKNLKDIEDKNFWTRSATPVLNLADGKTVRTLPIDTQVRVTQATTILGQDLLVLDDGKTAIETVYLSDKKLADTTKDLEVRLTALEKAFAIIRDLVYTLTGKK